MSDYTMMVKSLPDLWLSRWQTQMDLGRHWHGHAAFARDVGGTQYVIDAQEKSAFHYAQARAIREKYL